MNMTRKWGRKMILSTILLVVILIRQTVIASYENDYKPRWNGINHNQQPFHLPQALHSTHQSLQFSHRQHRHHHDSINIHKNNRDTHIKSKHNQTNDEAILQVKNGSLNNNRSFDSQNPVNASKYDAPTITIKVEDKPRPFWPHNNRQYQENQQLKERRLQAPSSQGKILEKPPEMDNVYFHNINHEDQRLKSGYGKSDDYDNRQSHQANQQHKERSPQVRNHQRKFLEKSSRIDYIDADKISHENQGFKSKDEYDEDYDEDDYYEEVDDNGNTIEVRREETETEGEIPDYMLDESDSRKEEVKSTDEAEKYLISIRAETGRRRQDVDYNSQEEYLNDESNPFNDEQSQNMSFTDKKWKYLGTPDAVREQFLQNKVSENTKRLREEGKCRWPHPKVIHVIEASDRFVPHCTILHRCADDTGCCNDDRKTCVAKSTTLVDLYFYITPFGNKSKTSIGFRTFENHTECHCVERNRFRRTPRQNSLILASNTAPSNENCRCPGHFRVVRERSQCRCDCLSWNQKCYDLKEGNERFSYKDQKCISENKCQKPFCEHGHYNKHSGRCPKLSSSSFRRNFKYSSDVESNIFNRPS